MGQSEGTAMNYEFLYGEDSLIIKLSGTAGVNERLLTKKYLFPHLRRSYHNVILDLANLNEPGEVYILGALNTIKKEFQMLGCKVKLCSLKPKLHRYFQENRLEQIFDISQPVSQNKSEAMEKSSDE
jgi:anti-anti-sigma regulatory factor